MSSDVTYEGSPCRRCKEAIRYTSTGGCVACIRECTYRRMKACNWNRDWEAATGAHRARRIVESAIKQGLLPSLSDGKTKCVDCEQPALAHDHRNYNRPLDVEPVCRSCNVKRGAATPMTLRNRDDRKFGRKKLKKKKREATTPKMEKK